MLAEENDTCPGANKETRRDARNRAWSFYVSKSLVRRDALVYRFQTGALSRVEAKVLVTPFGVDRS